MTEVAMTEPVFVSQKQMSLEAMRDNLKRKIAAAMRMKQPVQRLQKEMERVEGYLAGKAKSKRQRRIRDDDESLFLGPSTSGERSNKPMYDYRERVIQEGPVG